eukprot:2106564-Lingulodinium_polyedra.AAC.1
MMRTTRAIGFGLQLNLARAARRFAAMTLHACPPAMRPKHATTKNKKQQLQRKRERKPTLL